MAGDYWSYFGAVSPGSEPKAPEAPQQPNAAPGGAPPPPAVPPSPSQVYYNGVVTPTLGQQQYNTGQSQQITLPYAPTTPVGQYSQAPPAAAPKPPPVATPPAGAVLPAAPLLSTMDWTSQQTKLGQPPTQEQQRDYDARYLAWRQQQQDQAPQQQAQTVSPGTAVPPAAAPQAPALPPAPAPPAPVTYSQMAQGNQALAQAAENPAQRTAYQQAVQTYGPAYAAQLQAQQQQAADRLMAQAQTTTGPLPDQDLSLLPDAVQQQYREAQQQRLAAIQQQQAQAAAAAAPPPPPPGGGALPPAPAASPVAGTDEQYQQFQQFMAFQEQLKQQQTQGSAAPLPYMAQLMAQNGGQRPVLESAAAGVPMATMPEGRIGGPPATQGAAATPATPAYQQTFQQWLAQRNQGGATPPPAGQLPGQNLSNNAVNNQTGASTGGGTGIAPLPAAAPATPAPATAQSLIAGLQPNAAPDWTELLRASAGATGPGQNADFPFMSGYELPVRQTLALQQRGSPIIGLLSSLAQFSGRTPEEFWGDFLAAMPTGGGVAAPTRYA